MNIATFSRKTTSTDFIGVFNSLLSSGSGSATQDALSYPSENVLFPDWLCIYDFEEAERDLFPYLSSTTGSSSAYNTLSAQRTTASTIDFELERLAKVMQDGDEQMFASIANQIDWTIRGPEAVLLGIRYALKIGAHLKARQLTELAEKLYPGYEGLKKYIELLAPSRIARVSLPKDSDAAADMNWLKEHGEEYRGQWVALKGGVLLATAATWREVLSQLENPKDNAILVTMVY